jgi:hypothetical protein
MSVINSALLYHFRNNPMYGFVDNVTAGASGAPTPLKSAATQLTAAGAGSALILRSIGRGKATVPIFVVNNSAASVTIAPAPNETVNGGTTALTVPANQSALCIPDLNASGVYSLDWRAFVLT